jgi:hypothetical protein
VRRLIVVFAVVLGLLPSVARAQSAPACQFVLGFAALQAMLPAVVGNCVDDEQHNPDNGDALQHTTVGLLVWRKADNWTAFTDGYRTWINGPNGLVERLNSWRFPWEADANGFPLVTASSSAGNGDSQQPTATSSPSQATYHLCGPDPTTAQAIEQFIAGRNASSTLIGRSDGCADLTVSTSGAAGASTGQSTSTMTVDHLSVQIATAKGATYVTIGNV